MTIHRFFIEPEQISNLQVTLSEEISHQISQVLRLKQNDQIIILDDSGMEYLVKLIDVNKKHSTGEIIKKNKNENEPDKKVHLYQSLIARDNFELILQKSVELGVSEITPILTERTQLDRKFVEGKYERWQKIIKEAAEQSERGKLPALNQPLNFDAALTQSSPNGKTFIAWEEEPNQMLSDFSSRHPRPDRGSKNSLSKLDSRLRENDTKSNMRFAINIFIGPEGGFTHQEIEIAKENKVKPISLGKTILRAETAAIALLAKIIL
jgi:16S rRNA (uracil1498-N3)-methyltransferase